MTKPIRNWLRKRNWVHVDDMKRICVESAEAKVGNVRKTRALTKIADKAFERWLATEDEHYRELCNMAMSALNLKPRE